MVLFFEYSLLALGLFFFGLIGFWKGIEIQRKYEGFSMKAVNLRNPFFSSILDEYLLGFFWEAL